MKNNPFFGKAIYVLLPTILLSGELLVAQSDPGVDSEVNYALEQLEVTVSSLENSIRYTAPFEDSNIEAEFALEELEKFVAQAEREIIYKSPSSTDDSFDYFRTGEGLYPHTEYLTEIPVLKLWLKIY